MDFLRFFTIIEAERDALNPIGSDQLDRLATAVGLQDGQRVLDVGSGKGAMLRRWAMRTALQGTGVDLNPAFVAAAREKAGAPGLAGRLTFLEGAALDLWPRLGAQGPYDVATCLGATFALGGFGPTLEHLRGVLARWPWATCFWRLRPHRRRWRRRAGPTCRPWRRAGRP